MNSLVDSLKNGLHMVYIKNLPCILEKNVHSAVDGFILGLSIQFHWSVVFYANVLIRVKSMFDCYKSMVWLLYLCYVVWHQEVWKPPALIFLKSTLGIWDLFWFHKNFRAFFFSSTFDRDILKVALQCMDILKILVLQKFMNMGSYHLFLSSISFINDFQFSGYRCFISSVKLIHTYFSFEFCCEYNV